MQYVYTLTIAVCSTYVRTYMCAVCGLSSACMSWLWCQSRVVFMVCSCACNTAGPFQEPQAKRPLSKVHRSTPSQSAPGPSVPTVCCLHLCVCVCVWNPTDLQEMCQLWTLMQWQPKQVKRWREFRKRSTHSLLCLRTVSHAQVYT